MRIAQLSNEQLLASLRTVVGDERRLIAVVLAHLAEVEERRLHLEDAYSSMYDFCLRALGLSEDQACRRIAVARLGRRFPQLLDAISAGRMHLSGVYQLRELFTEANVGELIEAASGKTRAEIDRLIAKLAPKPDIPDSIRRLPEQASLVAPVISPSPALAATTGPTGPTSLAAQLVPLSEERYCVTLTGPSALRDKFEKARRLMRHRNPSGDLAPIAELALDLLIEKLEKERMGKVTRPRKSKGATDAGDVTRETRREVYERDGDRCSFVSAEGQRCPAREFLELDHRHARGLGGTGHASNVRVLCHAHNQLAAEKTFGRSHVEAKRRDRKRRRASDGSTASATHAPHAAAAAGTESDDRFDMSSSTDGAKQPEPRVPGRPVVRPAFVASRDTGAPGCAARNEDDASEGASASADSTTHAVAVSPIGDAERRHPRQPGSTTDPPSPRATVRRALIHLGFRATEADRALQELPPATWTTPLAEVIRTALAILT